MIEDLIQTELELLIFHNMKEKKLTELKKSIIIVLIMIKIKKI